MMKTIENESFDEERALYQSSDLMLVGCTFDGPADGESALKESRDITVRECLCNLRYPFWHDKNLLIEDTVMTENCRAALWYSKNIMIKNSRLYGIKALRECKNIHISGCDIVSPEFGWSSDATDMEDCTANSEYFMLRARNIHFKGVRFTGKYSFQYIENAVFEDCAFDTKDAFWHGKNITVKDSVVKGEYLAWYSENLTFEHCRIEGTQPLCWCKGLKLVNCQMNNTDLCFEKSEVDAQITTHIDSIKNPYLGKIYAESAGEIILDDENARAQIITREMQKNE